MKVVLFCGGLGTRIRDFSTDIPKPMVPIGYRPVLWQIMKYYSHFGYKDFILCLGYMADVIKNYFVNYQETTSNDFIMRNGKHIELLTEDISDWNITFVDTGMHSNIGTRLKMVKKYLEGEEMFMANYADGLTNLNLVQHINAFKSNENAVASFVCYKPKQSFHMVQMENNLVSDIIPMSESNILINIGYFIFRQEIFNYMNEGEDLVEEPFSRLIQEKRLMTFLNEGFWQPMDTFKDKIQLDSLQAAGNPPWEVWNSEVPVI
jgi:glucose-1-phosphate cytidylyltransferase